MRLISLATASPSARYTQKDCFEIFNQSEARARLKERSAQLMEKVLLRNNGIDTRGFCYPDIETIFDADPEKLNNVFEQEASKLGVNALNNALLEAELLPEELDALVVCTCTGYLCPGLSSYIAEGCSLDASCELTDLVGMGCAAAIPSMRTAYHRLKAGPSSKVAVIAVEICSAAFYLDDNPDVIISACLFGDGAAATIWTGDLPGSPGWTAGNFDSLHIPENRPLLKFENAGGALRNRLSRQVPAVAADAVRELYDLSLAKNLNACKTKILAHTGGRDVLDALDAVFYNPGFPESRKVLRDHGNMSSPSILYVLKEHLQNNKPNNGDILWLSSFGAGFSAYSMTMEYGQ